MHISSKIIQKYEDLLFEYGNPVKYWPQWCITDKSEELMELVAIGAILVQRTSWHNAELALKKLRQNNLTTFSNLQTVDLEKLTSLVRIAGFHTTKPRRLLALCNFVLSTYTSFTEMQKNDDLHQLRQELLSVYGIGPETADTILLFVLNKPSFIVDNYTKKFILKYNIAIDGSDAKVKRLFEQALPKVTEVYRNYHVLKILDQRPLAKCYMEVV